MQIRKVHGINGVGINGAGTDKVGMVGASTVYVGTVSWQRSENQAGDP